MRAPPILDKFLVYIFDTKSSRQLPTYNNGVSTKRWHRSEVQRAISVFIAGLMVISLLVGFITSLKNTQKWKKMAEKEDEVQTGGQDTAVATTPLPTKDEVLSLGITSGISSPSMNSAITHASSYVKVVTSTIIIHPTVIVTLTASVQAAKRGNSATKLESPKSAKTITDDRINWFLLPGPVIPERIPTVTETNRTLLLTKRKTSTDIGGTLYSTKSWKHGYQVTVSTTSPRPLWDNTYSERGNLDSVYLVPTPASEDTSSEIPDHITLR